MPIGSLLESTSESDSKLSNELKMSDTKEYP